MSISAADYQTRLQGVLVREFGFRRHAAKIIASLAGCSHRTAEGWLAGKCAPQGAALLNLMAHSKAVDEEMAELRAMARGEQK